MGCQKAIAKQIIDASGDYILAVKGNQDTLHREISGHFNHFFDMQYNKYVDVSADESRHRGRVETRKCLSTDHLSWLGVKGDWAGIKSVVVIDSKLPFILKHLSLSCY